MEGPAVRVKVSTWGRDSNELFRVEWIDLDGTPSADELLALLVTRYGQPKEAANTYDWRSRQIGWIFGGCDPEDPTVELDVIAVPWLQRAPGASEPYLLTME